MFGKAFLLMFLLVLFVTPSKAHAYLDPGTGSIILQALLAIFVGAGVFWRNILALFKRPSKKDPQE